MDPRKKSLLFTENGELRVINSEAFHHQYLPIWAEPQNSEQFRLFAFSINQVTEIISLYQAKQFPELEINVLSELPRAIRESVGSEWSRGLFFYACMPLLTMAILADNLPNVSLNQLAFRLDSSMTVKGVVLGNFSINHIDECRNSVKNHTVQSLIDAYLSPMILTISKITQCSTKILWANLVGYWRWWITSEEWSSLLKLFPSNMQSALVSRKDCAAQLIEQKFLESPERRNPLYHPMKIRIMNGQPAEFRRTCCQRYRLPHLEHCSYCPLKYADKHRLDFS